MDIPKASSKYLLNTYKKTICLEYGKGSTVYDLKGKEYIDLIGGIATCSIGHANPALVKAITEQASQMINPSNLFYSKPQVLLAKELTSISGMDKCFFSNSGTEAVETAIKIARKVTKKKQMIAMEGAFHGRTLGSLSATWGKKYKTAFKPLVSGFKHVPYGDIKALKKNMGPNTAAVILEPIQGEAGVIVPPAGYLKEVQELCHSQGALFILDEVQTGCGRTGKFYCFQNYGLKPDIVASAKGLANGIPIGATLAAKGIDLEPGDHGSTFGGNSLSCAAALKTVEVIKKAMPGVEAKGTKIMSELGGMPGVANVRGKGLMIGADAEDKDIVKKCAENGVLINSPHPGAIRLLPALTITEKEISAGITRMKAAFTGGE